MSINIFVLLKKTKTKPKPPLQCWVKGPEEGHANGHRTGTPENKVGIVQRGEEKALAILFWPFNVY